MKGEDQAQTVSPADEGTDWLYWEPPTKKWFRVELVGVPSEDPKRVRVQHLDPMKRGAVEWVPAGRVRVPWSHCEAYLAREERWARVLAGGGRGQERDAAWDVLYKFVPEDVASLHYNGAGGVLEVRDLGELATIAGMPADSIVEHSDAFEEDGIWYAPWTTTIEVVAAIASRHARDVVNMVRQADVAANERTLEVLDENITFAWMSREQRAEHLAAVFVKDEAYRDPWRQALLRWGEHEAPGLAEEYRNLQRRYDELAALLIPVRQQLRQIRTKKAGALLAQVDRWLVGLDER